MSNDMQKRERLYQLFSGNIPDRPPVAYWHHFYPGGDAGELAYSTYLFYKKFDADFAKIMPDLPFTLPDQSIQREVDWDYVTSLSLENGNIGQYIYATEQTRRLLGDEAPLLVTLFSPLAWLQYWVGLNNMKNLDSFPLSKVHRALAITADNLQKLSRKLLSAGADGIYYSVWGADVLTEELYKEFGRPYDLMGLEGSRGAPFNILHAHGARGLKLDLYKDYPIKVVSWSTLDSGIELTTGVELLNGKIPMGGWTERGSHLTDQVSTQMIYDEAKSAIKGIGNRLILAPGCSLPDEVTDQALTVMRDALN